MLMFLVLGSILTVNASFGLSPRTPLQLRHFVFSSKVSMYNLKQGLMCRLPCRMAAWLRVGLDLNALCICLTDIIFFSVNTRAHSSCGCLFSGFLALFIYLHTLDF